MGKYDRNFTDELRERLSIVDVVGRRVPLVKKGQNYWGCCPFHNEKTPSFSVNEDKGFYHCFGCGEHGDIISFIMKSENVDFKTAITELAAQAGLKMPDYKPKPAAQVEREESYYQIMESACDVYQKKLYEPEGNIALEYIKKRGFSDDMIKKYRIGYAPKNNIIANKFINAKQDNLLSTGMCRRGEYGMYDFFRDKLMFPIFNAHNQIVAFSGRSLDGSEPKYINTTDTELFHKTVWYRKTFELPERMKEKRVILHFGAVDYACDLWINGRYIREHRGGQTSFEADITEAVMPDDDNVIELKVFDDYEDMEMPRGKQFWEKESRGIFYTRTTGIWQSVWIEAVEPLYLESCYITPEFDDKCVCFEYNLSKCKASAVEFSIAFEGKFAACVNAVPNGRKGMVKVQLDQTGLRSWNFEEELAWTPETPRLFDVEIRTYDEKGVTDLVRTYFGMRKVSVDNGRFMLNNREMI